MTQDLTTLNGGLYDFPARKYSPVQGRFISPDLGSFPSLANPQSWNGYSYVMNNPVLFIDPSGNDAEDTNNDGIGGGPQPEQSDLHNQLIPYELALFFPGLPEPTSRDLGAGENSVNSGPSVLDDLKSAWLTALSPVQKAADWADTHPLIVFPVAIAAALSGNEGPIEADEEVIANEGSALLESIQAHGRTILMATKAHLKEKKLCAI